ncbi:uncharacterized protein K02A2.6-like [Entelurus aequoreus]|uniref:uncharacterized protein K02A2.6-like n=1 Tax=Entelurus aequoreus TaxID=161455 RepID=UPI002B1E447D|nr:uncharacterized protein K02A2.6-like [Entelurus aequoreus]
MPLKLVMQQNCHRCTSRRLVKWRPPQPAAWEVTCMPCQGDGSRSLHSTRVTSCSNASAVGRSTSQGSVQHLLIDTPGKHLILADALSRAPMENSVSATEEDVQNHVNVVSAALPVSDIKTQQIAEETAKDEELQRVITNMQNGWPPHSSPRFFHVRGELSVVDGLLLKRNRIVIPQTSRQDILQRIHEGHLGVEKCKRRARDTVYWPGINKDIDNMIGRCSTCQKYRNKQTKRTHDIA